MVQILSTESWSDLLNRAKRVVTLETQVWRKELNHPPTAVGGIQGSVPGVRCRKDLKKPPTAVGGISTFCAVIK